MAHYNCMLIDLDNTLLDFDAAEASAIAATLAHFELPGDAQTIAEYRAINEKLWREFERGSIKKERLLTLRFSKLLNHLGRQGSPAKINDYYLGELAKGAQILPGADEFLADVEDYVTVGIITNGAQKAQMGRLEASGIGAFADGVFISEKLGVAKPDKRFVNIALEKLGVSNRKKVLVVGDSLAADIKCGAAAGLDTCWCNFREQENDTGIQPTYTVRGFEELKTVILEQEELDHVGEKKKYQL
ncbi:noncanonical pyrimidine nucleotidase, YjjG family [Anaerofilum sp. BX8]|uniref:Noncanonical pyrimidine nucleotidase, YjjG family n=1 Tax=Anaerofilum hominis TaxID=2763016 RepID=A0A923IDD9_9FIRM|nr:YjjG family noncanonical pyrimidine nucleotidase [Anaerofilum hominis]MBC5580247.1 noncanonical pyrimidine nucleotidase, YjjG family [Anaerofilum hominis]